MSQAARKIEFGSCTAAAMECGDLDRPASVASPSAIPAQPFRAKRNSKTAYRYVTDPEALRLAVDDMDRQLKIERSVLQWALTGGRRLVAIKQREWIDYAETARRNASCRLRQLEAA